MAVKDVHIESGYLIVDYEGGNSKSIPAIRLLGGAVADYPSGTTVPDLSISSLTLLTTLGNLVEIIVKSLVERDILDEEMVSGYDLQYILDTLADSIDTDIGD